MVTIKVDYDKCKGHGDCVDSCPGEVYELKDGKAVPVNINDCVGYDYLGDTHTRFPAR